MSSAPIAPTAPPTFDVKRSSKKAAPPSLGNALSGLGQVKLKKTKTRHAKKASELLCNNSEEYQKLMEDTYMEQYFDLIADFSFKSTFQPLSVEAAAALVSAHDEFLQDPSSSSDFSDKPLLVALAAMIDAEKKKMGWPYVFVRTSARSPKDAALSSPKFEAMYNTELKALQQQEQGIQGSSLANQKLHALYRASTWSLRTEDGATAVRLLIEADRTYDDFKEYVEGKITGEFNIVIREFRTFLPEMEFRGFIYKNKFTALTQYNEFCCFPALKQKRDAVVAKITEDFQRMMKIIPQESYVVDFVLATNTETDDRAVMADVNALSVWIVELNPLAEFAGTGLFTWGEDRDVLLGRKPFEFRYHSQLPPLDLCLANMTPEWRTKIFGDSQ